MTKIETNHFDFIEMREMYGMDIAFLKEIISLGLKTFLNIIPEMRSAMEDGNLILLKSDAHRLKGTAMTLSCKLLTDLVFQLESMVDFNFKIISELLQKIENEILLVREIIKKELSELEGI